MACKRHRQTRRLSAFEAIEGRMISARRNLRPLGPSEHKLLPDISADRHELSLCQAVVCMGTDNNYLARPSRIVHFITPCQAPPPPAPPAPHQAPQALQPVWGSRPGRKDVNERTIGSRNDDVPMTPQEVIGFVQGVYSTCVSRERRYLGGIFGHAAPLPR